MSTRDTYKYHFKTGNKILKSEAGEFGLPG